MNDKIAVGILVGLCLLILTGCSGGGSNPALPAAGSDSNLALTSGPDQAREVQQSRPRLIGYYDVFLDLENRGFELVPNRSIDFALNLMFFLNTPTGLSFNVNDVTSAPDYIDIDIDITLNHPLDDAMFDIYDVRAIFMGDGTEVMSYDSDLIYGGVGTHQGLLNADGYSRWFNPTGFDGGTLFDYVPNFLSTPDYTTSATLNPYKYYGEGLGATDDLWTYLAAWDPATGYFFHGSSLTRNFLLRFPIPVPGFKYAFAIIANWEGTEPIYHPSHANEAVGVSLEDYSTLYYVDELNYGGNLDLDITIFDWDAELTGNVMLDYDLYIESTVLYSDYKVNPGAMVPTVSVDHWNTFHVEIPADIVLSTAGNELWVIIEDNFADYSNPAGLPNDADDDPLAALFRYDLVVLSEPPPPLDPWILVTDPNGGENWPIGFNGEITWDSHEAIENVKIVLSMNSGASYDYVLIATTPNNGLFEWNSIPIDFIGTQNRIKVSNVLDQLVFDESDADFTISGNWLEVTSPNGGESWTASTDHDITWESSSLTGLVNIEFSTDGFNTEIFKIAILAPNTGIYLWEDIPFEISDTITIRVINADPPMSDTSDGDFSIVLPPQFIQVLIPNGWEEWGIGSGEEITWDSAGVSGNVNILYSHDNFVSHISTVASDIPNVHTFNWLDIPDDPNTTSRIKIESVDEPAIFDVSNADFRIIETGWVRTWGVAVDDSVRAIVTDPAGNIFVTGDANSDLAYIRKFDSTGALLWSQSWGSEGAVWGRGIACDADGYLYVTGGFNGTDVDFDPGSGFDPHTSDSSGDIFLSRFDPSGNFEWARTWGGVSGNFIDGGGGVGVVGSNVYAGGWFTGTDVDFDPGPGSDLHTASGSHDAFLTRFTTSGNFGWAGTWGGPDFDAVRDLTVDASGRIFVTGPFSGTDTDFDPDPVDSTTRTAVGGSDVFLSWFSEFDVFQGVHSWGGLDGESVSSLAVDGFGNIYVTGGFSGTNCDFDPGGGTDFHSSNGVSDCFLSQFNSLVEYQWVITWGGLESDSSFGVTADPNGFVTVVGSFMGDVDFDPGSGTDLRSSNGNYDSFLSRFDFTGFYMMGHSWGGIDWDYAFAASVTDQGMLYVGGQFEYLDVEFAPVGPPCNEDSDLHDSNHDFDAYLSKYLPDGCW